MRHIIPTLLILASLAPLDACGDVLTVSYLDRPPYYYTDKEGKPEGFLLDLTRKIFQDAGIEAVFKELPPNRIMYEIRKEGNPHCSIGWFRTPERETYAKFSLPIYQDKPLVIMTSRENAPLFSSYTELSGVFSDGSLVLATVSSFSYGDYVDELIRKYRPRMHVVSTERSILPRLIRMKRASYLLTAPEEVSMLVSSAGYIKDDFTTIPMRDLPSGNLRYLMYSRDVTDDVIKRIDVSIKKLVGDELSGKGPSRTP